MTPKNAGSGSEDGGLLGFGTANWAVLAAAVVCITIGYVLLDRGSVTAAPFLLVLGYVILFPTGLMLGYGGTAED